MYLVVARMNIKFSKELGTTYFIQDIINDRNGKFVLDGEFVEGVKFRTHVPRAFFLKYHDHMRRIEASTSMDNARNEQFLNNFLNLIFLGKGMTIRMNIGRKFVGDEGNGMIMNTTGRRNSLGSGKNSLMLGEDGLDVRRHKGCINGVNGMELCNNVGMTIF
jgi:hypothetical protein